ncbi:hypothetical protein BFW87_00495 [Pseudomonas fluorescens]|uniref:NodB homology domain-containing protein n=1 Tax=Pseudomonas fluorescens TaxID=294 RepID=A0A1T2Z8F1_PSEFL|nr:polysaccharide deacetylase family protein [Pseudomonas fluorescens]OPB00923.1 hypothetical protein BFW87_00495 [Pseudomonas fluorescens]
MKIINALSMGIILLLSATAHSQDQSNISKPSAIDKKYIALTFDDGPQAPATPALLDVLKKYDAKATFFVLGSAIVGNAPILRRMMAEGHTIGNHTLTHSRLTDLEAEKVRSEITTVNALMLKATGKVPEVFRPPYGVHNDNVVDAARANGLAIILWNKNPDDSNFFSTASVISDRIIAGAQDGDIVFLHDTSQRSVEATEMTIRNLSEKGFVFVTVENLIKRRGSLVAGQIYKTGNTD